MSEFKISKNTDIPWDKKKLDEVCLAIKDGTHGSFNNNVSKDSRYLLSAKNIKNGRIILGSNERMISQNDYSSIVKNGFPQKDDLLLTTVGTIGEKMIWEHKFPESFQRSVSFMRVNNLINNKFLYYSFSTHYLKNEIKNKTKVGAQPGIYLGDLKSLTLLVPSLSQQIPIASILSTQESIINDMETLVAKYETRLRYLSEELLSGRLRVKEVDGETIFYKNKEWKEVEVNGEMKEIPVDWEVEKACNFITLIKGASIPEPLTNYVGNGHKYLKTTEFWLDSASKRETSYAVNGYTEEQLKNKDEYVISFDGFNKEVGKGTVGLVSCEGEGIVSTHFFKIKINNFYHFSINFLKTKDIQESIVKNAQGSISLSATKHFKFIEAAIPSENKEMQIISKQLEPMHFLIKEQKELIENEKKKFDFLLNNLLSGNYLVENID